MTETGRFIAFEGGEGAGKSTQIRDLAAYLTAAGHDVLVTREPGGTEIGQELRRLLLTEAGRDWIPAAETLLMLADRAQHVAKVIRPALARGQIVISDRYAYSTLAYQGAGRGMGLESIYGVHVWSCGELWPDLTIVIDVPPKIGLARSTKRLQGEASAEGRFEGLDLAFHGRVRDGFRALVANAFPGNPVEIDGTLDAAQVQIAVRQAVGNVLGF